jgi:hypothetical protein
MNPYGGERCIMGTEERDTQTDASVKITGIEAKI